MLVLIGTRTNTTKVRLFFPFSTSSPPKKNETKTKTNNPKVKRPRSNTAVARQQPAGPSTLASEMGAGLIIAFSAYFCRMKVVRCRAVSALDGFNRI